ncbi:class II fructose-bisphosphatase [Clostridium guangxiense]|uniref:class II fructose-bisphosphatase n=1 Tax=Clostridium guangxiense TaxID=1662055 RepID=UPI001E4663B6|nr:class II fructose-bisphosphatase [Clostridium guangxiense]MCD2345493.1 class II fructose-bisphosphatase [Clostridium guangxiense]
MDGDMIIGLAKVTEAAAIRSAKLVGRGDKNEADGAAVDGMNDAFASMPIRGTVVIGEGELDEAPMLYIGQKVGKWEMDMPEMDIAVDPVDGTTLIAKGLSHGIAVVAMGTKGTLLHAPDMYMEKIAVGRGAKGAIDIGKSPMENMINTAKELGKDVRELTVLLQDRDRHNYIIEAARRIGAKVKVFGEGDVEAILTCGLESLGVDIFIGTGGAPEGVIAAAAIKCLGGDMQCRLKPYTTEEINRCLKMGIKDINKVLTLDNLVKGEDIYFSATGITKCEFLDGVIFNNNQAITHTMVMNLKDRTTRFIKTMRSNIVS